MTTGLGDARADFGTVLDSLCGLRIFQLIQSLRAFRIASHHIFDKSSTEEQLGLALNLVSCFAEQNP